MTTLMLADHLKVSRGLYSHHALYIGNNQVIHYAGKNALWNNENSHVQITSLEDFAAGETIYKVYHNDTLYSADEIIRRAKSRLNEDSYSILFNNCEHFVNWCITGENCSAQVDNLTDAALSLGTARLLSSKASAALVSGAIGSTMGTTSTLGAVSFAGASVSLAPAVALAAGSYVAFMAAEAVIDWLLD
ncbi:lecithin retinol acyltransferase family protein [Pseudomonas sp. F1_0610]|uniref:lecithin retinol acyltransferase family protein n=1 Tax=Pseudomonas sp. F1_0610 TaxID=3114284 RepID=UPI0039C3BDDF